MWNKDNDSFHIFRQYEEGYRIQRLKYTVKKNNDGDTNLNNFRNNDNDTYQNFRKYEEDQRIDKLKCIDKNNNDGYKINKFWNKDNESSRNTSDEI